VNKELLSVEKVQTSYGNAPALFDVSLSLAQGSTLAVVGTNGAGKSTLARTICGLVPASAGRVTFAGEDITHWDPHKIRKFGISYMPEERGVFPELSVVDNLRMSVRWVRGARRSDGIDAAFKMFPVLEERKNQRAGSLSGGEQQMLSIARGLAVQPRLLIVDELSLGLAPLLVGQVFDAIDAVRGLNISIILIEQYVNKALEIADQCLILRRGAVSWSGPVEQAGGEVLGQYMGDEAT
jgi:branched-chain amino acid transport system ATP-binding protein